MKAKLLVLILGGILAAGTASATVVSGISSFSATANTDNNAGFEFGNVPAITTTFNSNVATITNTVITCTNSNGCNGTVLNFELGMNGSVPLLITIDGTLTGATNANGTVTILGLPLPSFSINTGSFNATIVNTLLPPLPTIANGTLALNMANGQVLTLPDSFSFTVNPPTVNPEPGTITLIGLSLAGLGVAARKCRS